MSSVFARRGIRRTFSFSVVAALLIALIVSVGLPSIAHAEVEQGALSIDKRVDKADVGPGETFTYTIAPDCSSVDCVDTVVVDTMPAEFADLTLDTNVLVTGTGIVSDYSWSGRTLTVNLKTPLDAGGFGLPAGRGPSIQVHFTVPVGMSPNWAYNGVAVPNTATVSAANADSKSDSATVTVRIPWTVDTAVTKTWSPASAQFSPGLSSTIALSARNTSNALASSIALSEPADPLAAGNPFNAVDFAGFGAFSASDFPQGADQVAVDAFVGGAWVLGTPGSTLTLPAFTGGLTESDITGLRVTFTDAASGATIAAGGTAAKVSLSVTQRALFRTSGLTAVSGSVLDNIANGTVVVPGQTPVSKSATARHTITGLDAKVTATKAFSATGGRIPAGTSTTSTITATNTSNGPLDVFTITEPGSGVFFDANTRLTGFVSGSLWPDGATAATVGWSVNTGTVPADSTFTSVSGLPALPTLDPGQYFTGFVITYTGKIAAAAKAIVPFRVAVDLAATGGAPSVILHNSAWVDGANAAGNAVTATATADLTVLEPTIEVTLDKTISPAPPKAVPAGGRNLVLLDARTSSTSGFVDPTIITIVDEATSDPADYWQAFTATAIAPTQVSLGSTLEVFTKTATTSWASFGSSDATLIAKTYQAALPAGVTGVKFVFSRADGFSAGTAVRPGISFTATDQRRDATGDTAAVDAPVTYTDSASVLAEGTVAGGTFTVSDTATDTATSIVKKLPTGGAGGGGLMLDKDWQPVSGITLVNAQSAQQRTARIAWGTEVTDYSSAVVSDPADPSATVSTTVFQAFDLYRIKKIGTASDPSMAFDQVVVELFDGTTWTAVAGCTVADPCTGNEFSSDFTLSATQRANTVAVRFTFSENAAARATDPAAPPIGSGVTSGPDTRPIDLIFQLRNKLRVQGAEPSPWITETSNLNGGAGLADNVAGLTLTPSSGSPVSDTHTDTLQVLNSLPQLSSTKSASPSTGLTIPSAGDIAESGYPVESFTVTARNDSQAKAWFLRVTDPMPCADTDATACVHNSSSGVNGYDVDPFSGVTYDPATNPFERFTITKVSFPSPGSGITLALTKVIVWKADGTRETLFATDTKFAGSTQTSKDYLAQVVGVSALFTGDTANGGTIASGAVGTVTIDTMLRKFLRSAPTTLVTPATVTNWSFSQVYDNVLNANNLYSAKKADVPLSTAIIETGGGKTFKNGATTISSILESARTTDITVALTGSSTSTASPAVASTASVKQVVVSDSTAAFWNAFTLKSFSEPVKPGTADRVQVDVQLNGTSTWVTGTAAAAAALPTTGSPATTVPIAQVTGIRFIFTKADGTLFSTSTAVGWSTSVNLVVNVRDNYRDSGSPVVFSSTSSITNVVDVSATHPALGTVERSKSASFLLDSGTFIVDVEKRPSTTSTPAGEVVNFSLIVKNTGTGYLTNPVVVDTIPADARVLAGTAYVFDPTSDPTFSTSTGGILPTTGVTVAYDDSTHQVSFVWPTGSRLAPGETYTIVLPLQLAPGYRAEYGAALNSFSITTDRVLASCTNSSGNGQGRVFTAGSKTCSTSNSVTTYAASAISSFKGVKGNVDSSGVSTSGAVNTVNAAKSCVSDSQGFYRTPCAANTVIGGTDLWKLQYTNGGNVPAETATVIDVLPKSGDKYLITGSSRASAYAPVFAGGVTMTTDGLSARTTMTWQVTTTANPCSTYASAPASTNAICSAATWVESGVYDPAEYPKVTAIRMVFNFSAVGTEGTLPPAAVISTTYKTVNTPTTSAGDGRAPVTMPISNVRAWNTFGVYATFGATYSERVVEPVKAGVQLTTGPLLVTKVITGASSAFAPVSYAVTVTCSVAGATITLPSSGALTLSSSSTVPYTGRIDGIPVGAECRVTENAGHGASSVSYSPAATTGSPAAAVTIAQAGASTDAVPVGQQATVTNSYGTQSLTVSKAVTTATTLGSFGPFSFSLTCSVNNGATSLPVTFAGGVTTLTFSLADTASKVISDIPVRAVCQLIETDSDGATNITVSVDGGSTTAMTQGSAKAITISAGSDHTAAVTNNYKGGKLAVTKTVDGTGGTAYGSGPFTVAVDCSYQSSPLYSTSFSIVKDETVTLTPIFPIGTDCQVTETTTGGATTSTAAATVSIPAPTGGQTHGLVTAGITNTFTVGSLVVKKAFAGSGKTIYGTGPFTAQASCTWVKDGATLTIPLPDSGRVTLQSPSFEETITGLIAGARCTVTEPEDGAATSKSVATMSPATVPAAGSSTVTITNTYDTGSLVIVKDFDGPGETRFGAGPFVASVECSYVKNGVSTAIDLGADDEITLDAGNHYTDTITGLLVGASCTVAETNMALATSSAISPLTGIVTIRDAASSPATVTITNYFSVGQLQIEKTASNHLVDGFTDYSYDLEVENVGTVNATGVKIVDVIDANIAVTAISSPGWTACAVGSAGPGGFGGTLTCVLDTDLGAGAIAPTITLTVDVLDTVAQDQIDNTATVTSTNPIVDGDSDDETVQVKWLEVAASTTCVKDAPYLDYTVDAHNLTVSGRTLTVNWADSAGNSIHDDTVSITSNGTISGRLLFPGAAVAADGTGTAWPGWRAALPGETPDWEGLVLDSAAYGYGLRDNPLVTLSINPQTTVQVTYPPASSSCVSMPTDRDPDLTFTKRANVQTTNPGDRFDYTMSIGNQGMGSASSVILVDHIPTQLKITGFTIGTPKAGAPAWTSCVIGNQLPNGYSGTITCELDRALNYNETAPDVVLSVQVSPTAARGIIVNTARVTAVDPDLGNLATLALQDSAMVSTAGMLAYTGAVIKPWIFAGLVAFGAGLLLLLVAALATRRRRLTDDDLG